MLYLQQFLLYKNYLCNFFSRKYLIIFLLKDLDKSLAAQKALLQQQQELEAESAEMQDFLQEEKATLMDALKDAESEVCLLNSLLEVRRMHDLFHIRLSFKAQEKRRNLNSKRDGIRETNRGM